MVTNVVVFVPGTTGSTLNYGNLTVWPISEGLDTLEEVYELKTNNNLDVVGINLGTAAKPGYNTLYEYFTTAGNFTGVTNTDSFVYTTAVDQGSSAVVNTDVDLLLYVVPYDWRHDNVTSAAWLNRALNYLDASFAGKPYALHLLAHSMGGLVTRYVLENSTITPSPTVASNLVTPGAWLKNAKVLVTLATPHFGAPLALSAIAGLRLTTSEPEWLIPVIKSVVDSPLFPSTYELLPPPPVVFVKDSVGDPFTIYSTDSSAYKALIGNYGASAANLTAAQTFFASLNTSLDTVFTVNGQSVTGTPIPYHCFVGTALPTQANPDTDPNDGTNSPAVLAAYLLDKSTITAQSTIAVGDTIVPAVSAKYLFADESANLAFFPNYTHGQMAGTGGSGMIAPLTAAATLFGLSPTATASVTATTAAVPA